MDLSLPLNIAGIGFRLNLPGHEVLEILSKRYENFAAGEFAYDWQIAWGKPNHEQTMDGVSFAENGAEWHLQRDDFQAHWNNQTRRGSVLMEPSEYTVDSWLRVWLSSLLLMQGGGLFHAAGLLRGNRGELFIGRSGCGKSTLARACGADEILSDELTAVRRYGAAFMVHGTPFMGELGVGGINQSAPLKRFFMIHHGDPPGRMAVPRIEALPELWGTLMCFSKAKCFLDAAMQLCDDMAAALPCERFSFDHHDSPWRLLDYDTGHNPDSAAAGYSVA